MPLDQGIHPLQYPLQILVNHTKCKNRCDSLLTRDGASYRQRYPMAHYHQIWTPKANPVEAPITHWTDEVGKYVRAHMSHFKMVGIAVAVFVVLYGLSRGYQQFRESAATQLFIQSASQDLVPPRSVLETVSEKYPRTAAGKYADWLLATQHYQEGKFTEAAQYYNRLAERTSTHKLYHLISASGAAYAEENLGNYTLAAEIFTRLSKIDDNPFADQDLLNAGRNQRLAGHPDLAKQLLESSKDPAAATQLLSLEAGLAP